MAPSNPKDIVRYAVEATKIQALERKIVFDLQIEEPMPLINANTEKTAWVLTNLILNAIHYSYENSKIIISAKSIDNAFVKFSVQDFGKGIDSQYQEKIFTRYFRVPGSNENGSGLGLAIGKEFIEAQGGKIYVESEVGIGSTFSFELKILEI
jgi:signal transduction histidine kinase